MTGLQRTITAMAAVAILFATMVINATWLGSAAHNLQLNLQSVQSDLHGLHSETSKAAKAVDLQLQQVLGTIKDTAAKLQGDAVCQPNSPKEGQEALLQQLAHVGLVNGGCTSRAATAGVSLSMNTQLVAPVVIIAYNRVHYLARAMVSLLKPWMQDPANAKKFPLYVSIDGGDLPTTRFALAFAQTAGVQVIRNERSLSLCKAKDGHCHLALHYLMVVQLFFKCLQAPRLIFLEEDLEVAPDFFNYFEATAPLLQEDSSLLCVSAWNDHGQRGRAVNHTALYRTDVMPGLGWMLNAATALELLPGWVNARAHGGWDEYLRAPCVRKGRQCIFPEVSRTYTFGKVGNSQGMFFHDHLENIVLNNKPVDFVRMNLTYLHQQSYARLLNSWLAAAVPMDSANSSRLADYCSPGQPHDADERDLLLYYDSHTHFLRIAEQLAPMLDDMSLGGKVPRQSCNGTVIVRCRGRRLFLVAEQPPTAPQCEETAKE